MSTLVGAANAQFNDPPALENRNGRLGFEFYMLEVPDPSAMTADASDWGWFNPERRASTIAATLCKKGCAMQLGAFGANRTAFPASGID